jgi:hypothetical protein
MRNLHFAVLSLLVGIFSAYGCGEQESTNSAGASGGPGAGGGGGEGMGGGATGGGATGGSGGGAATCEPMTTEACYGGPAGTQGVGACVGGTRTCSAEGTFGPCVGEVVPSPEDCATPMDEDCDSMAPTCGSDNLWSRRFGAAEGLAIAVDGSGNPIVVGRFPNTINFGGNNLTSSGGFDAFIVKFDGASGEHLWSRRLGGSEDQAALSVAVDPEGNVLVVGEFLGQMSVGGGNTLTSAGGNDMFVAKYGGLDGDHIWSRRFGDGLDQSARGIAVTKAGHAFITGSIAGTVDFDSTSLTSAGSFDVFLLDLDAEGNPLGARRFGDSDEQNGRAVAVDSGGNPVVTGDFRGVMDMGAAVLTSAGGFDLFVMRLDATANPVYAKSYGNKDPQRGYAIATTAAGNAVVSGIVRGDIDFGGGVLSATNLDVLLLELTPAGAHVRSRVMGGSKAENAGGIAVGAEGRLIVAGGFQVDATFGGATLSSKGGFDAFLARHDSAAELINAEPFGDGADQSLTAVATDAAGRIFVVAHAGGTIDFGSGALSGAEGELAIAKLAP